MNLKAAKRLRRALKAKGLKNEGPRLVGLKNQYGVAFNMLINPYKIYFKGVAKGQIELGAIK